VPAGRVCFFVGDISLGGGTERAVATIASGLAERGWQVTIVCMRCEGEPFFALHPNITMRVVLSADERFRWKPVQTLSRIRKIAKDTNAYFWIDAETVLSVFSVPALAGLGVRHFAWENFHLHEHLGSWLRPIGRAVAAFCCRGVVVLTRADRDAWLTKFGSKRAIHQIPHCVQTYAPAADTSLANRKSVVLAVGRHTNQKGFDLLLQAWSKICMKHPSWQVRIVGSGELTVELQALAATLGVYSQVEWVAHTNDVETHYLESSVYALSSRFEGFGIVLIEALSHGLPIVSFLCHHGPEEIIEDRQSGLLVESGNVDLFAQALDQMITDEVSRKQMARAALKRSEAFAPPIVLERWEQMLMA
jgi:glycosyltransferase involved in cell wall biosynthesis